MTRSKRELEQIRQYKDYPDNSVYKEVYDSVFLSFSEYLNKYYATPDLSTWNRWQKKYLEPAYDKGRHEEMIKNFGYTSINMYDFDTQYKVFHQLEKNNQLDDETRRFIGFLAGNHFFDKYKISVQTWFTLKNWSHPDHKNEDGKTINEILGYRYGINMLKTSFPQMPWWKRF